MTVFFGLAVPRAENCRITSEEMVTVWPNITWPMSMVTSGVALTSSASRAAAEENLRLPSVP